MNALKNHRLVMRYGGVVLTCFFESDAESISIRRRDGVMTVVCEKSYHAPSAHACRDEVVFCTAAGKQVVKLPLVFEFCEGGWL